jgi:putative transposase
MADRCGRRERLVERIRLLPAEKLHWVEELVGRLEGGDQSTPEAQRLAAQVGASKRASALAGDKDWPHAPTHRLSEHGTYIVTAGTLGKEHRFRGAERLGLLERALLSVLRRAGWQVEAWAVFSNHYHFVAHSQPGAMNLRAVLTELHGATSRKVNLLDGIRDRTVWYNFWDTELTFEKSYLARLNYVHQNAVKHGLAPVANQYPWCSAAWFERTASRAQVRTIYRFQTNRVKVPDEFQPL